MPLAFLALFKHFQYNKVVSKLWQAVAVAASVLGSYVQYSLIGCLKVLIGLL